MKVVGCALCPTDLSTFTDAQGQFAIPNAPVGALTLFVDGETTTRPEEFPHLTYQFTTIAGQDNTVGRPIQLPIVDVAATKIVGGDEDVVLTMTGVPGVAFTVFANSARTPSGERYIGPLTLSQVSSDKAPMPLPNNSAPQVVWTLQPANIHFVKPIQVQLPNTTALAPGQVVEVFSFDHALEQFVSGGLARVSPDASVIVSDPGFGINVSGWGGAPPPPPPQTCAGSCDDKNDCTDDACVGNRCVNTNKTTPPTTDQCRTLRCEAGRGFVTEQKDDGTPCDDEDFCTEETGCMSGVCTGKRKPDRTLPSVAFNFNIGKLLNAIKEPIKLVTGNDLDISVQLSGSAGATEACCNRTKSTVKNANVSGALTVAATEKFPLLNFPFQGRLQAFIGTEINLFLTTFVNGGVTVQLADDECEKKTNGSATVKIGGGGGISAEFSVIEDIISASIGGSTGFSISGTGTFPQGSARSVALKGTVAFEGVTLTAMAVFLDLFEESFTYTLLEPSSLDFIEEVNVPIP